MKTRAGMQLVWYRRAMSADLDLKNLNEKENLVHMRWLCNIKSLKDESQTALFKDPVRTAL